MTIHVNELLCFISNKIDMLPVTSIIQLCSSTYSDTEIEDAKKLFFDLCSSDSTIRFSKRQGPNKNKSNLEDIMKLMQEKPDIMQVFVAKDLNKLPPISFDNIDVSVLLDKISKTQTEVKMLSSSLSKVNDTNISLNNTMLTHNHKVNSLEASLKDS